MCKRKTLEDISIGCAFLNQTSTTQKQEYELPNRSESNLKASVEESKQ
jgi:hypothetical protein